MICYIGVGSNLGNRLGYIRKAIALLKKSKRVKVKKVSSVYETVPVGGPVGQRKYLNLALKVQTRLLPSDLLLFLKETERKAGRKKRN
ncbi:MAG TPA: 2-amino-4-hydroxy-6-hydroxymethyldihydropteridine diphosphokinase, partial [Candidatus Omnitrophota bacterium]|nr:2-amino-4-hydroxy-6-hydroxymethyldihydropteridine diphosphokinase [Candidatus Omnitrophota bacterium]